MQVKDYKGVLSRNEIHPHQGIPLLYSHAYWTLGAGSMSHKLYASQKSKQNPEKFCYHVLLIYAEINRKDAQEKKSSNDAPKQSHLGKQIINR